MTTPITPNQLAEWLNDDPQSVGDGLLMLSSVLTGRAGVVDKGRWMLDELADSVGKPDVPTLVEMLFGPQGFRGNVEAYHAEDNSLLDRVLEQRVGMPITLSALVVEVGTRLGMKLTMVGMPGHVVVGTESEDSFIDAFSGVELDRAGLERRFQSIFGGEAAIPPGALQPMTVLGTVNRVCNNLLRAWADDRSGKVDRLLELRTLLPGSPGDRRLLIEIATSRGRFDLAARLRAEDDPDDPQIKKLWARLN